jgi:uncharacterized protein YndB with AHSA1/START domain
MRLSDPMVTDAPPGPTVPLLEGSVTEGGARVLETLTFGDLGGERTRLHALSPVERFEARDARRRSGVQIGVDEGYTQLDRVVSDVAV